MTTALVLAPEVPQAHIAHPVTVYLASLAARGPAHGSYSSRETMRGCLDRLARLMTGDSGSDAYSVPWQTLRLQHVTALRTALLDQGLTPATVNKYLSALKGVLRACWRLGLMSGDDYQLAASVPAAKGETVLAGREVTAGERVALMAVCATDPSPAGARDAALVALLYACLFRRAEVVSLTLGDYDAASDALTVRYGKGHKARIVYVSAAGAKDALEDWLAVRAQELGDDLASDTSVALFVRVLKSGRVTAQGLSPSAVALVLAKRAREAGVAALSPHDFRRTGIGDLLDAGADLAVAQRIAGHADVTTTARYDRRPETAKKKAASLLHVPYVRRAVRQSA